MKVYISGPMRGRSNNNYDAFNAVDDEISKNGIDGGGYPHDCQVLNPAKNFDGDQGQPRTVFMRLALEQLLSADVIVQLPGWHHSEGARLEAEMGVTTGKKFYEAIWQNYGTVAAPDFRWAFREVRAQYDTI